MAGRFVYVPYAIDMSAWPGTPPAALSDIENGELFVDDDTGEMFFKDSAGTVKSTLDSHIAAAIAAFDFTVDGNFQTEFAAMLDTGGDYTYDFTGVNVSFTTQVVAVIDSRSEANWADHTDLTARIETLIAAYSHASPSVGFSAGVDAVLEAYNAVEWAAFSAIGGGVADVLATYTDGTSDTQWRSYVELNKAIVNIVKGTTGPTDRMTKAAWVSMLDSAADPFRDALNDYLDALVFSTTVNDAEKFVERVRGDLTSYDHSDGANVNLIWEFIDTFKDISGSSVGVAAGPFDHTIQTVLDDGYLNGATFAGTVKAGVFNTTSSRVAKQDVSPFIEDALALITDVDVVSYRLIRDVEEDPEGAEDHVGFIAEDVSEVLSGPGKDKMRVSDTIGVLIKAVQQLAADNAGLQARIEVLENV